MTTQILKQKTFFQRFGNLLTGNREGPQSISARDQPKALEASVVLPFSPPAVFVDYSAEGDEPADLALIELIPAGLKSLNLPYTEPSPGESSAPVYSVNACPLSDRPLTETEMTATELAELVPLNLSSLNKAPKSTNSKTIAIQKVTLESHADNPGQRYQKAANQTAKQPQASNAKDQTPLPDLSTLRRAEAEYLTDTVRIPTAHLEQLNQIVEGLLQHQQRQERHNEQLGALVKQLLGRVAKQQTQLNRFEQGSCSSVQEILKTGLTNSMVDTRLAGI
ncbi:MAG: hypothetical protein AAFO84_04505 [Cyanobacteria bacterium J06598_1]